MATKSLKVFSFKSFDLVLFGTFTIRIKVGINQCTYNNISYVCFLV